MKYKQLIIDNSHKTISEKKFDLIYLSLPNRKAKRLQLSWFDGLQKLMVYKRLIRR